MKVFLHCVFMGTLLGGNLFFGEAKFTASSERESYLFHTNIENDHKNFRTENYFSTFAEVDAAADQYASTKNIFGFQEENDLRKSLLKNLEADSHNIALNWALMRYYAAAPNFVGGSTSVALQYAGYVYSLNQYLGCLAFEYVYTKRKELEDAEFWYKQSLITQLPKDMYWEEIIYSKTSHTGIKVTGNFNNWKVQNMYSAIGGTYKRRVMVPKCETCIYKVIVDYSLKDPTKQQLSNHIYW